MSESPVPRNSDHSISGRHVTENSIIATLPADKKLVYRLIQAMLKHQLLGGRELIRIGFKGLHGYLSRLSQEQVNQILVNCRAVNPEWKIQYDAGEATAILFKPYEARKVHSEDLLQVLKQDDLHSMLTPDVTTPLILENVLSLRSRVDKGLVKPEHAKAFLADVISLILTDMREGTFRSAAPTILLLAVGVDAFLGHPEGVEVHKKALKNALHLERQVGDRPNICEFDAEAFVAAIPTELWASLPIESLWNVLDLLPGALGLNEAPANQALSDHVTVPPPPATPPPAEEVPDLELEELMGPGARPTG